MNRSRSLNSYNMMCHMKRIKIRKLRDIEKLNREPMRSMNSELSFDSKYYFVGLIVKRIKYLVSSQVLALKNETLASPTGIWKQPVSNKFHWLWCNQNFRILTARNICANISHSLISKINIFIIELVSVALNVVKKVFFISDLRRM